MFYNDINFVDCKNTLFLWFDKEKETKTHKNRGVLLVKK